MAANKSAISMSLRRVGYVFKNSYRPWIAIFWGTGVFALNTSGYFLFNRGDANKQAAH